VARLKQAAAAEPSACRRGDAVGLTSILDRGQFFYLLWKLDSEVEAAALILTNHYHIDSRKTLFNSQILADSMTRRKRKHKFCLELQI